MPTNKLLTISIIIPVYNEAHRLKACLDSVASQTTLPNEVIVVDNNSTDDSAKIASKYKFVTVITEEKQGLIFARNAGFDFASSDILGRIDADSMISPDWAERVTKDFSENNIFGLTGPGYSLALPRIQRPLTTIWSKLYFFWTHMFYRVPVLWGANMAIRSSAWRKIKNDVCLNDHTVHEDQDISLLLQAAGGSLLYDKKLLFTSFTQSYHYFPKLLQYIIMRHTTRNYHRTRGTLNKLNPDFSKAFSFVMYAVGWPIIFVFLFFSFLSWPLDSIMKLLGREREWLS